jgi:Zn-dependent protease
VDTKQRIVLVVLGALAVYAIVARGVISADSVIFFAVLIPSVILHEVTHGAVALLFGDDTAKRAGRLTLNPVAHIDPLGTILLPAILILTASMAFGYAKPVPVNPRRMRSPRNHGLLVALAGPATNIVIAMLAAVVLVALAPPQLALVRYIISHGHIPSDLAAAGWGPLARVVFELGFANVILAAFNLIPIPPLDGSAVVERLLPRSAWPGYLRLRQYAMPVLLIVVLFGGAVVLDKVFRPAFWLWSRVL